MSVPLLGALWERIKPGHRYDVIGTPPVPPPNTIYVYNKAGALTQLAHDGTETDLTTSGAGVSYAAPGSSAVGDSVNAGVATTVPRSDHRHGREAFGAVSAQTAYGASSGNGSALTVSHSDHQHGTVAHDAHANLTGISATDHHTNVNDPSTGEKAALAGTSGTPGSGNKYVTDGDARNTDARTPAAHAASHAVGQTDAVTITHAQTTGQTANDHHNQSHDHSASGDGTSLSPATLVIPAATSPAQTAEGSAVWDSDDDKLTVGTGSTRKTMMNVGDAPTAHATSHAFGGSDIPLGMTKVVIKASSEAVGSSIALQDDNELLFSIAASETWIARFVLFTDGATAGDIQCSITAPSGATGRFSVFGPGTSATTFESATANNQAAAAFGGSTGPPAGTLGAGNVTVVYVEVFVINSTTPGSITLQWAQRASSVTDTHVLSGSFLTAWRVS